MIRRTRPIYTGAGGDYMSYQIAGRMSWLVSWLDGVTQRAQPLTRTHWLKHVAHNVSSECLSADDDELISQTLAARQLRESVEQLPSHERQVLLLHVNNGLTYWEIAARLGMDEQVVLRDLAHAYSQLRLELSTEELTR
jgi:RNA polymerase sigma factor (sigma-70 family)